MDIFEEPVAAGKARKLGNAILTEAMKRNGHITFNSYDRFFPNQDRMPEGGFGNLIALPLQGRARKWETVSLWMKTSFSSKPMGLFIQCKKLNEHDLDMLLARHRQEDFGSLATSSETKPWVLPVSQDVTQKDFNGKLKIKNRTDYTSPKLHIRKGGQSSQAYSRIQNPEFTANKRCASLPITFRVLFAVQTLRMITSPCPAVVRMP